MMLENKGVELKRSANQNIDANEKLSARVKELQAITAHLARELEEVKSREMWLLAVLLTAVASNAAFSLTFYSDSLYLVPVLSSVVMACVAASVFWLRRTRDKKEGKIKITGREKASSVCSTESQERRVPRNPSNENTVANLKAELPAWLPAKAESWARSTFQDDSTVIPRRESFNEEKTALQSTCVNALVSPKDSASASSDKEQCVNREFGLTSDMWLNFYEGLDIKVEDFPYFRMMSNEQRVVYKEFRKDFRSRLAACKDIDRMKSYVIPDEITILRFLQADKYNTRLALKRLLDTVVWRQKLDLPGLVRHMPTMLDKYRSLRVRRCMGLDKEGRPVFCERIGEFMNILATPKSKGMGLNDFLLCYIYEMGEIIKQFRESAKQGTPQWKNIYIADAQSVKFMAAIKSINLLKSFSKDVEIHFPEQAGPIFVVNSPSIVAHAMSLFRKFLDPTVVSKIQVHPGIAKEALLEYIDESVLFREYGGTNDADYPHIT